MSDRQLLLGRSTDYDATYSPDLLHPLPRQEGRARLGLGHSLPFTGWDIWNGYELSWLDSRGKPVVAWGEFRMPAESPRLVESKSFKLYLNALNHCRFDDVSTVEQLIAQDLAICVGAPVVVKLRLPADWPQTMVQPEGACLDDLPVAIEHYEPAPQLLSSGGDIVEECLFSRLLRSRCPVTGQPDWGAVAVQYRGPAIDRAGLLAYLISYRLHQDFHEQCVERIFLDVLSQCRPQLLTVGARYLRRGGLDINPWRTNDGGYEPRNGRLFQQ